MAAASAAEYAAANKNEVDTQSVTIALLPGCAEGISISEIPGSETEFINEGLGNSQRPVRTMRKVLARFLDGSPWADMSIVTALILQNKAGKAPQGLHYDVPPEVALEFNLAIFNVNLSYTEISKVRVGHMIIEVPTRSALFIDGWAAHGGFNEEHGDRLYLLASWKTCLTEADLKRIRGSGKKLAFIENEESFRFPNYVLKRFC
jgi:hypothetical protein